MKNQILSIIIILFSVIFIGCNESSKGNWSDTDKNRFRSVVETVEELNSFGEYKSDWIECYLNKCESNYSSFFSADSDEAGCTELAIECSEEIFSNGSVLGNWSDTDKNRFRSDMETVEELNLFGEYKSDWIECYLNKCESNYSSYFSADSDEAGCTELALECSEELF